MVRTGSSVLAVVAAALATGLLLALGGCGGTTPGAGRDSAGLTQPLLVVESAQSEYLRLEDDVEDNVASDPSGFFTESSKRLAALRTAERAWNAAASSADLPASSSPGFPSQTVVQEYSRALDAWITAQEEQAAESEKCWTSPNRETCYATLVADDGARWQSAADRLNAAHNEMAAWSPA